MFTTKKTKLFEEKAIVKVVKGKSKTSSKSPFVEAGLKKETARKKKEAVTKSANGAKKYSRTASVFVNQFSNLSLWKAPRKIADIWKSQDELWTENALLSVKFILFMRMITRIVFFWDGSRTETVQRGSGLKFEAIGRMLWLAINVPDTFWKNVNLFIAVGSWKDIFKMMEMDLVYHGWEGKKLDFDKFSGLIILGLANKNQSELIKKYLPSIDARSRCTTVESQARTMIAKFLASKLDLTYEQYRKLKSNGTAHSWQKLISQEKLREINFDSIHGRALMLLVNSKFLKNNGLVSIYEKWINDKPVAKFTGYVHELAKNITPYLTQSHVIKTINAQFNTLVEKARENINPNTGLICVVDTSGSMGGMAHGQNMTPRAIAQAMSVFFANMLEGHFKNAWIEFNNSAKMHYYKTEGFVEMYKEGMKSGFIGSTNFQSVINLFCQIKNRGVSESDFPTGILCLSDGEFNPSDLKKTNVESARKRLLQAGFSPKYVKNFKIILWNIPSYANSGKVKFETYDDVENVFYLSGYDGSIVSFILEGEVKNSPNSEVSTAEQLFEKAMNQEVLEKVEL
jgi:hypothetical protein